MTGVAGSTESRGSVPQRRLVVNLVGDAAHGQLTESRFVERPFLPGGEHNMYELAFAAAAAGFVVELRGWIEPRAFHRLRETLGAAPSVELPARMPTGEDLIVVPEGWQDPLEYARLLLSPAQIAIFILAAPGLFGWPFGAPGWQRPDPLSVDVNAVAKPAHFQAMHALGFRLLTHSPGIVSAAEAAGVPCVFVGTGRPAPIEPPAADAGRPSDVAALLANRWEPLVRAAVPDLDGLCVDLIEEAPNDEVIARLSKARILLWPSRIEGHATIPWEARSVGCVPVALSSNRFAVGLSEAAGAVVVDTVEDLAPAARRLLADPPRWSELSARAIEHAREEADWAVYVERVMEFLGGDPAPLAGRFAAGTMGVSLHDWELEQAHRAQAALEEMSAEAERLRRDRDTLAGFRAEALALRAEELRLREDRDRVTEALVQLQTRRAVRIALRIADARKLVQRSSS
jgi:hypothetical protein